MSEILSIVEVARQTGITSRTLRYYEARGLVRPLRTASGRRCYGPGELTRIHQIMLLKRAGLSLKQIGQVLAGSALDMAAMIRRQLDEIGQQRRELDAMELLLEDAMRHVDGGGQLTVASLCQIIRNSQGDRTSRDKWKTVFDRYWSPEAQHEWHERMGALWEAHPEWADGRYEEAWSDLTKRIEAALPLTLDGDEALGFVREWNALTAPMTKVATPAMGASTAAMFEAMDEWPAGIDAGFSKAVWQFIRDATGALRAAGRDIGQSPFPERATRENDSNQQGEE
ncbi:MerR family transcriptional regulator [Sphingomicrobium flavum]|uniref:MerR family transcriptional regulator n=1 Tax=Sphingomicrobium flavum TaxID=1229164 RepID=UPI0021ADDA36|nr:MerR family transcriptional regulator [Sphingomicrobium flavum]